MPHSTLTRTGMVPVNSDVERLLLAASSHRPSTGRARLASVTPVLAAHRCRVIFHRRRSEPPRRRLIFHPSRPALHRRRVNFHPRRLALHRRRVVFHRHRRALHRRRAIFHRRRLISHPRRPALPRRRMMAYRCRRPIGRPPCPRLAVIPSAPNGLTRYGVRARKIGHADSVAPAVSFMPKQCSAAGKAPLRTSFSNAAKTSLILALRST